MIYVIFYSLQFINSDKTGAYRKCNSNSPLHLLPQTPLHFHFPLIQHFINPEVGFIAAALAAVGVALRSRVSVTVKLAVLMR